MNLSSSNQNSPSVSPSLDLTGDSQPTTSAPASPKAYELMTEPIKIVVPGNLPSWNQLLGMPRRRRFGLKKHVQRAILSVLQTIASGFSTRITVAQSSIVTLFATAASCLRTHLTDAKLKS